MRTCCWAAIAVVAAGLCATAQNLSCGQRNIFVQVNHTNGMPMVDLPPSTMALEVRGKRLPIVSAQPLNTVRRAVILLDASGSMVNEPEKWSGALTTVRRLLAALPQSVPVAYTRKSLTSQFTVSFEKSAPRQDIVADLAVAAQMVGMHTGKTAMLDWIDDANAMFDGPQAGDAIFVISDGSDNTSKENTGRVEKRLIANGVRLLAIVMREPESPMNYSGPTQEDFQGLQALGNLAVNSGGRAVWVEPKSILKDPKAKLGLDWTITDLANSPGWIVGTCYSDTFTKWSSVKLVILDATGNRRKDVVVSYPHLWPPCNP
jgi:hypothetical protein